MPFNPDDSFTLPTGATNAFAGQTIASATWDAIFTDIQAALSHNLGVRVFAARTINFNPSVATDTAITVSLTTASYMVDRVIIANANHSLTTAVVGLYTAVGAGGLTLALSQSVNVSTSLADTANNMMTLITASASIYALTDTTLQFRIVTAEGATATADVILYVRPL